MTDLKMYTYQPKHLWKQALEVLAILAVVAFVSLSIYVFMMEVAGPRIDAQFQAQSEAEQALIEEMRGN